MFLQVPSNSCKNDIDFTTMCATAQQQDRNCSSQIYCKLGGIHTFNHGDDDDEKFLIAIFFVMHDIGLARCSSTPQLSVHTVSFSHSRLTPHTKSNRIKLASTGKVGRPKIASEIIP